LELGEFYPANTEINQELMPLSVAVCNHCSTTQIPYRFPKEVNFPSEYSFRSANTKALIANFNSLGDFISQQVKSGGEILEIGSNDGTLLDILKNRGYNVEGVEPTKAALETNPQIVVHNDFFENAYLNRLFDAVVLTNTLAHLDNPSDALNKIRDILRTEGKLIVEVVNLEAIFQNNEFDKFTHEHGFYFNRTTLRLLMDSMGFLETYFEEIETHGGSFRAMYSKLDERIPIPTQSIENTLLCFSQLQNGMSVIEKNLKELLQDVTMNGSTIYLAGATNRGETLLKSLGIKTGIFKAVLEIDKSPRLGTWMRNLDVKIVNQEEIEKVTKPVVLILAWHVHVEIIESLKRINQSIDFIISAPKCAKAKS
jgi:SAM-dependent methyltransferase